MAKLQRLWETFGFEPKYEVMVVGKCGFAPIINRKFDWAYAKSVSVVYNHMRKEHNEQSIDVFVDLKGRTREEFKKDLLAMYEDICSAMRSKREWVEEIKSDMMRVYDKAPHESLLLENSESKVAEGRRIIRSYQEALEGIGILRTAKPSNDLYRVEEKS